MIYHLCMCLCLFALCSALAVLPEPFAVMNVEEGSRRPVTRLLQTKDAFPNLAESDKSRGGFAFGEWDYNTQALTSGFQTDNPFPLRQLNYLIPRGEYGMKTMALRAYRQIEDLGITVSDLRNPCGSVITAENVLVLQVARSQEFPKARLLFSKRCSEMASSELIGLMVMINVPSDALPGSYAGKVSFTANRMTKAVALKLRIPDIELPQVTIPIGCFMPYEAMDQGLFRGRHWSQKEYTTGRQPGYFRFLASRGLNSPSFFHFRLEFSSLDSLTLDFRRLDSLVRNIVRQGKCQALVLDLRDCAFWADRLSSEKSIKKLGLTHIDVYKKLVKQLCDHARYSHYPPLYLLPEEEIAYPTPKQECFLKYGKALLEVAGPNRTILIDNGTPERQETDHDLGFLFKYQILQYNTWSQHSLNRTDVLGHQVWSYNYSFKRPSFGLLIHRLNSRGHHQWADVWGANSTICIPTDRGVVSSLEYEMAHEGIVDYRCLLALKSEHESLRCDLVKDVPVENPRFNRFASTLSVQANDLRRWLALCVTAHDTDLKKRSAGACAIKVTSDHEDHVMISQNMVLKAPQLSEDYHLRAAWNPRICHRENGTGPLRFTMALERYNRAMSSSEEEFKARNTPSCSNVWVSYNPQGIILLATQNHTTYKHGKFKDNDPDMWQDDCMEFFFRTPDLNVYQVIVNSSDAKVLLKTGEVQDSSGIQIVSKPNLGKAGGLTQEVLIPWSVFGLRSMPCPGTVWTFNAGREFHAFRQLSSWARVEGSFHEYNRWGTLKFTGKRLSHYLKDVKITTLYPGQNTLRGTVPGKDNLILKLFDDRNHVVAEKLVTAADRFFAFSLSVPALSLHKLYSLSVSNQNGTLLETESISVFPAQQAIDFKSSPLKCCSGEVVSVRVDMNISVEEIQKTGMAFRLNGNEFEVVPPAQSFRLWVRTAGLAPGEYLLEPVFRGSASKLFTKWGALKIIVYPSWS